MATEKRLISVDEWDSFFAEHIYNRCFRNEYEQGYTDALDRVDDWMDAHPTVDAMEVVHGRWKYYHKQNIAVCTNCSFERDLDANFGRAISCPNCGAKMDGDGNG